MPHTPIVALDLVGHLGPVDPWPAFAQKGDVTLVTSDGVALRAS